MQPVRVTPLVVDVGTTRGHRLVLLSLEVHRDWADLRYARIESVGAPPLPRRVPRPDDWTILVDGEPALVVDAVGRGDRAFSNGEVRIRPAPAPGAVLDVSVRLAPGEEPLETQLPLPD